MRSSQEVAFINNSEVFKRLAKVTKVAMLTPEERYHYEADVKNARDTLNQIRGAFQEGEAKGRAEGREEGRDEERRESIRFMLSLGISPEAISQRYRLSQDEILAIKHSKESRE